MPLLQKRSLYFTTATCLQYDFKYNYENVRIPTLS